MTRRWHVGQRLTVSGVSLRVLPGRKAPDDLRMEAMTLDGWRPVDMALAFALVDFFTENEDALRLHRPFWRQNGQRYFLNKCVDAVRRGWLAVADEIVRQREDVA